MEFSGRRGEIYCNHCGEYVSKSTYRRHKLLGLKRGHSEVDTNSSSSECDSESALDSPSHVEQAPSEASTESNVSCSCDNYPISPQEEMLSGLEDDLENDSVMLEDTTLVSDSEAYGSSDGDASDDCQEADQNNSDTDDGGVEHWEEITSEDFSRDVPSPKPLLQPDPERSRFKKVNALVFWLVYFLLLWQTSCKLSDNGLVWLLQFLFKFLKVIGITISNEFLAELIFILPSSLYMLRQFINIDRDYFTKYVVCPKCTKLYGYDSCLEVRNNQTVAKRCSNIYISRGRRKTCDAELLKQVQLKDGKEKFYPIYYYCYNSIIEELERLLQQPGFAERCEEWKNVQETDGCFLDVYSGQIWREFQNIQGKSFLSAPRNYGLMLNFDFFQPIKHRKDYSVGVLYLVILNLPRHLRFKWENVIVIGIIPSMDGEPKNLNEFLQPAVDELNALWKGVKLKSSLSTIALKFRAALLCVAADIPAARKLCGFKGHSAYHGCSRCLKVFPGSFGEKSDYSGFDRENWKKRTNRDHRVNAKKLEKCKTLNKRNKLSKEFGINHWSALLDLEYFDVVRFCSIDPMHNLFLGTSKYIFKLWDKRGIIGKKEMKLLEQRIEEMDVPTDIGRLPKKISSNYGSYTAEQWKNWTLIYSMFVLNGVIPDKHLKCFQTFVLACKYLCKSTITTIDLQRADLLLLKFCKQFEKLYGREAVTPNMHLHCHLKEIILDHGPVHSFWCFSFERYNGIMGNVFTNKRSLELQLMRKLMFSRFLDCVQLPLTYKDEFQDLLHSPLLSVDKVSVNPIAATMRSLANMSTAFPVSSVEWSDLKFVFLPSNYKLQSLVGKDREALLIVYKNLYPQLNVEEREMAETIKKFSSITIGSQRYGSKLECRSLRSARVYASWADERNLNLDTTLFVAGCIMFFFTHSIKLNGKFVEHAFACVMWHKPDEGPNCFGNPTKIWKLNEYVAHGPSRFMPVQRIYCRYCAAEISLEGEKKLVTVALDNYAV